MKLLVLGALVLLCAAPQDALAQQGPVKRVKVYWSTGHGVGGYESASIEVRYKAVVCDASEVVLLVELDPASIEVSSWYHYKSARYLVQREPAPVVGDIRLEGWVSTTGNHEHGAALLAEFSMKVHSYGGGIACLGQTIPVGKVSELVLRHHSLEAFMQTVELSPTNVKTLPWSLRSGDIETKINDDKFGDGIAYNLNPEYGHKGRRPSSSTSSSSGKLSDSELKARIARDSAIAAQYEAEGDGYMALGATFWPQAFAAYQKAQDVHYTDQVHYKMEKIRPALAAAYVAGKGIETVGKGTEKVVVAINAKTPMFRELEVSWRTAMDGEADGWSANFRFGKKVYAVAGMGRTTSQLTATLVDESDRPLVSKAVTWKSTYGEIGVGLALRFWRNFDIRAEGVVALGYSTGDYEVTPNEMDMGLDPGEADDLGFDWGHRLALSYQIPSTPLALSVHYKSLASKFSDERLIGGYSVEDFYYDYFYLNVDPSSITTYHYLGISLGLRWRDKD